MLAEAAAYVAARLNYYPRLMLAEASAYVEAVQNPITRGLCLAEAAAYVAARLILVPVAYACRKMYRECLCRTVHKNNLGLCLGGFGQS